MKRTLTVALLVLAFGLQTVHADVIPPGQKVVPVCAYFTNTESMLDQLAIYGYEVSVTGEKVDLSKFIKNECFRPTYKFNHYYIYGVTIAHDATINAEKYDPSTDMETYLPNIELTMGEKLVADSSTLTEIRNAYKILGLNEKTKKLDLEYVQSEEYSEGSDTPKIIPNAETAGGNVFTDVGTKSSYYNALKYLKDEKVISGYDDGSFKPDNNINRAEFTKIVVGAVLNPSNDDMSNCEAHFASQSSFMLTIFKDVEFAMVGGNVPVWYLDYVCLAKLNNYIGGYPDGTFKPEQNINFVEAAKIITLAMGYKVGTTEPWYKGYVEQLSGKNAIPLTIRTFNQNITRGEMAEIMYRLKAGITTLDSATYADIAL